MQAALCQRAIEQWETVPGTLPGSDGQSHVYTADEKARYVAALKKEIAGERTDEEGRRTRRSSCPGFPPQRLGRFRRRAGQGGADGV